jgi:hypothetical protein
LQPTPTKSIDQEKYEHSISDLSIFCFQNSSSLLFLRVLRVFLDDARALYLDVNVTVMGTTELSRTQCSLEKVVNE